NITELTDVDSGGINVLLLGICQELGIRSVLTTQVINWARTSVRECDLARRLVHYAATHRVLPKHLESKLVTLRDVNTFPHPPEFLDQLSSRIKDNNFRIFAQHGLLHLLSANLHLTGQDPFQLFEELLSYDPANMDPSHAFYLGYEFSKAVTALTLNKEYSQDESLDWGYLTAPEASHRLRRYAAWRTKKS
ncbi:MAG: dihydropteroate synthase, partial [Planctomycetaceae bacterium]|nr:dihydropteroate synthase [Planctomycetaceae bacterium]